MGLKFSGCANNYEALVPRRNEPSVLLGARLKFVDDVGGGSEKAKKCIIMHVGGQFRRKVHYNALFVVDNIVQLWGRFSGGEVDCA
jgi:hypothetical protein